MKKKLGTRRLKKYLKYILALEIKKPLKNIDTNMVSEYTDWYLDLEGIEVKISEEEIVRRAKALINNNYEVPFC